MYADTKNWVASCKSCAERKQPKGSPAGELQPTSVSRPWQRLGIDFVGPLPTTKRGNCYILVFVDYLTKYGMAFATSNHEALTVAKLLVNEVILRFGSPEELLSDRGAEFMSVLIREVCNVFAAKKIFTTAYHPQTNGLVEHLNGSLKQILSMYVDAAQDDWDEYLAAALYAYNTAKQESTGFTPFSLLFGHESNTPADVAYGVQLTSSGPSGVLQWRDRLVEVLAQTREIAKARVEKAQQKQAQHYDGRHKAVTYEVGDAVFVLKESRKKGESDSIRRRWRGPYYVTAPVGKQLYRLQDASGVAVRDPVNVGKMKRYTARDQQLATQQQVLQAPPVDESDDDEEPTTATDMYEVESIVEAKGRGKNRLYLVKWKGYPESQNTWEPRDHFRDQHLVEQFEQSLKG